MMSFIVDLLTWVSSLGLGGVLMSGFEDVSLGI